MKNANLKADLVKLEDFCGKLDPEIQPLTQLAGLPVESFHLELLPSSLAPWARDMQHRLQCPLDYIGVSLMIGLASVVGNKVTIQPKANDHTWKVVPNLWGLLIGEPSSMKSPAMSNALKPVSKMDERLRDVLVGSGINAAYSKRLVVRDATIEQVQIIQSDNPTGLLYVQDEISALFRKFDQPSSNDRQYLLEAFNGDSSYSVDRVTRESVFIEKNTLSLVGTIQPDVLQSIFLSKGSSKDGFMQRLQLAVWPDAIQQKYVDEVPDLEAAKRAIELYAELYDTEERTLRFCDDGQAAFEQWYKASIDRIDELATQGQGELVNHITKYRKLVPTVALLIELAENSHADSVSLESVSKAVEWANYLVTHAKRIYGIHDTVAVTAQSILDKRYRLSNEFTPSEVVQRGWKGLKKTPEVRLGIELLAKHNYLIKVDGIIGAKGGRPSERYRWNHSLD
jgi:putative DNA primase/helicase